ncbi:hypothetical protein B0J14DRAFT_658479 [Halenospora varia]|nr:hypothetical protein B0J14DRAFT_658479 [Halenospora varia]
MEPHVPPYSVFTGPQYGKTQDLILYLGYPKDSKTRKHHLFRGTVADFRKNFVERNGMQEFPLQEDAPEVTKCADEFLEAHGAELFPSSEEADINGWPIYPPHEQRIKDCLRKLMCKQETIYRRNVNAQVRRTWNTDEIKNEGNARGASLSPFKVKSDGEGGEDDHRYPAEDEQEFIDRHVAENIEVHMDYAYPLHEEDKKEHSIHWLFNTKMKVDQIDPFAVRYLHEFSIYHSRATNANAVSQFLVDIKKHYQVDDPGSSMHAGIAPESLRDGQLRDRIKKFITVTVPKWMDWKKGGFGFLIDKAGEAHKSPVFEKEWRARRLEWLNQKHEGSSEYLLEWNRALDLPPAESLDPDRQEYIPSMGSGPLPKRHKAGQNGEKTLSTPRANPGVTAQPSKDLTGETIVVEDENVAKVPTPPVVAIRKTTPSAPAAGINRIKSLVAVAQRASKEIEAGGSPAPAKESNRHLLPDVPESLLLRTHSPQTSQNPTNPPNTRPTFTAIASNTSTARLPPAAATQAAQSQFVTLNQQPLSVNTQKPVPKGVASSVAGVSGVLPSRPPTPTSPSERLEVGAKTSTKSTSRLSSPFSRSASSEVPPPNVAGAPPLQPQKSHQKPSADPPFQRPAQQAEGRVESPAPMHVRAQVPGSNPPPPQHQQVQHYAIPHQQSPYGAPPPHQQSPYGEPPSHQQSPYRAPPPQHQTPYGVPQPHQQSPYGAPAHHQHYMQPQQQQIHSPHTQTPYRQASTPAQTHMPQPQESMTPQPTASFKSENATSTSTPKSGTPKEPHLFAIEDTSGMPDDDPSTFVPKSRLDTLSLPQLFALVAARSGTHEEKLMHVTFRYEWRTKIALVVSREGGEKGWKSAKGKMGMFFNVAQGEYPRKKKFLVFVAVADTTRLVEEGRGDDEEDDDDE